MYLPHPQMNGMKQVNARCSLLLCLASSEAMVDSLSYDILNAEEVDGLMKVRAPFQFSASIHPKLFHHRNKRYYHMWGASKKTCNISQNPPRCTNLTQLKASSCLMHRRRTRA